MNFQNIQKATAYQRDSTNRTASEKILDKYYRQSYGKISELEKQLYDGSAKKKKIEKEPQKALVEPSQALQRIMKSISNPQKALKALQLLEKLLCGESATKLTSQHLLQAARQLVINCSTIFYQTRVYNGIQKAYAAIFEKIKKNQENQQILTLFTELGPRLVDIFQDDNFMFSKAISTMKSMWVSLSQTDIANLNRVEALNELKQIGEVVNHIADLEQSDSRTIFKRTILFNILVRLFDMSLIGWRKPTTDQFLKEFNMNLKDKVLSNKQKKQFSSLYQNYLKDKTKKSLQDAQYNKVDKQILSTPLNSHHEAKDNRKEVFTSDGADRWSSRQAN